MTMTPKIFLCCLALLACGLDASAQGSHAADPCGDPPGRGALLTRLATHAHRVGWYFVLTVSDPPSVPAAAPSSPASTGIGAGGCPFKRQRASQAAIAATSYFDNRSQWLRPDGGITISPAKSEADR